MFIGHYGAAFVAASRPRAPSLATLFVAAQLIDYGFFALLLLGVEHMRLVPRITAMNPMDLYAMPYTHSLLGALLWALGFGAVIGLAARRREAGVLAGLVVLSHWLIDLLVHRPDLTLAGAPPRLGLGLWNLPAIEVPLELAFAYGGLLFFARATRPRGMGGRLSIAVLAIAMAVLQAVNWLTPQPQTVIDPAPASAAWLGLFAYSLLALLAAWVARSRMTQAAG